jgi:tetratricopeptide (TPR) repeat protein
MTSDQVTQEEQEQILQTIEMFEVIAQSNPDDSQSLEILKEAYWKLGRQPDALAITRKLADSFVRTGQYSSAMLEYEDILQKEPESPDIIAILADVEAKLQQASSESLHASIPGEFGPDLGYNPTLITTSATVKFDEDRQAHQVQLDNDGNEPLAKFLMQHQLAPDSLVISCLDRVRKMNRNISGQAISVSLIDELCRDNEVEIEQLLSGILDRTKFAYVPLEYYDVDRQVVKMLPESLTLGRLIVPFDIVSRTVMVAMANPFDASGKEALQHLLDYNIQWHLASPAAINKVLRDAYRLDIQDYV